MRLLVIFFDNRAGRRQPPTPAAGIAVEVTVDARR